MSTILWYFIFEKENTIKLKNNTVNLFSILNRIYRDNTRTFFTNMLYQKLSKFSHNLSKIEIKIKFNMKRIFFFEMVKTAIKHHRLDEYFRTSLVKMKSLAFKILYSNKNLKENKSNQHMRKNLLGKSFYSLKSYYELKRIKLNRLLNSRNFYIKKLILKSFKSLKFQLFKKQLSEEENSNIYDDKLIFNFFHEDGKRVLLNSRKKFMEEEISSKRLIRNRSTSKDEKKKYEFNKELYDLENSKSFLDTLKNSHCSNIFSKNMYSKNQKENSTLKRKERMEIKDFSNNEVDNLSNISYIPKRKNKISSNNDLGLHKTNSKAIDSHTEIDELLNNLQSKYQNISKSILVFYQI